MSLEGNLDLECNSDLGKSCLLRSMLSHWLRRNYHETRFGSPTWENLANAVKKGGDTALVANILGAHCQNYAL